jgi:type IV pilus assembly protein PilB
MLIGPKPVRTIGWAPAVGRSYFEVSEVRKKIGECLIQAGLITKDDLRDALAERKRTGERLGVVLVRLNLATEEQIARSLALQLGFPYIDLSENPPDPGAVVLIPKKVAVRRVCISVRIEKNLLTVAMADPLLYSLVQDLELQTGYLIRQVVAARGQILNAIQTSYPDKTLMRAPSRGSDLEREDVVEPVLGLKERSEGAPIIDLVELVVKSAIKSGASDVHVEPTEKGVVVRHRLDGVLKNVMDLPRWAHEGVIARLKMMAAMDIAEKRLPQNGRIRATADDGVGVDFRVSTLRTLFGEKVVMRVLERRKSVPALEELGMSATALEEMRQFLRHQHGMILVVGPTGSGKTTTLSSALTSVQSEKTNIITIEDPVEYQIPGVNQTQIDEKIDLTFASGLQSILRQDPDVILIGEIRDADTAAIAMQAAQTGRLVLSTLRTDDAPSAVARLTDIGTEPFVTASALIGIVAQRLVRRLCVRCRRPYTPPPDILRALDLSEVDAAAIPFYESVGCDQCNHTGYRGRIGLYEVLRISDKLRRLIAARSSQDQLWGVALQSGMITLGEDGLAKVKSGITTPEELLRVVTEVREMRALCPQCGTAVGVDFMACPHCGKRLNGECQHCGRALQPGWNFCPYCSRNAEPTRIPGRLREREVRDLRREHPAANVAEFKK